MANPLTSERESASARIPAAAFAIHYGINDSEEASVTVARGGRSWFLAGGKEAAARSDKLLALVDKDPLFDNRLALFQTHSQQYEHALAQNARLLELKRKHNLSDGDLTTIKMRVGLVSALDLHQLAFLPTLRLAANDEQRARWLDAAEDYRIIGCYAQTELGHGSNVQALETTATFIPETDEIELHTPTLSATKWWPGCMGKTATHAIVYARLLLPKASGFEDKGIHGFMLQIRDMKTHETLPGLTIGDIGPKMGSNAIDNGFMQMNRVRVPRFNMLARFSSLARDGAYSQPSHAKAAYGTMVYIRAALVVQSGSALSKATTIAVRYGLVRQQFDMRTHDMPKKSGETSILDYPLYQGRTMPLLADTYALLFTGRFMQKMYHQFVDNLNQSSDFSLLPELHAASAGLKSYCTSMAAAGIEVCRRGCGGHGYQQFSGLGSLFCSYVGVCTAEGDNYLLTLQTGRYLIKQLQRLQSGQTLGAGTVAYLAAAADLDTRRCPATDAASLLNPAVLLDLVHQVAIWTTVEAAKKLAAEVEAGADPAEAFTAGQNYLSDASNAHCVTIMASSFDLAIKDAAAAGVELKSMDGLRRLFELFTLSRARERLDVLLQSNFVNADQAALIRQVWGEAVKAARPYAVPFTDAFQWSDNSLNSALGRFDGKAYETLLEWVKMEPLNQQGVPDAIRKYIQPLMKATTSRL